MRISRLYTPERLAPGGEIRLDDPSGHYVFRVLKLRAGDPLVLFNGDGADYAAELTSNRRDRVEVRVTARLPALREPDLDVTLVQAVSKGDRMDYSLQKATELGVAAVRPLFSERTEVRLDPDRLEKRTNHWHRVMIAACEQSGRAVVPRLLPATSLADWLVNSEVDGRSGDGSRHREGSGAAARVCLAPGADRALAELPLDGVVVEVLVGPEGGFSDAEFGMMTRSGVRMASLGPRVLRTETAGPAAMAVLQALHGDLRG